ncbi:MAG: hypothetical protein ACOYL8_03075 [Patescibacteria group bacterium]
MFDYLQKFNNLPKDLRDKVSSPEVMAILAGLEKKYQVDLAIIIMKVMIKSISLKNLTLYFVSDLGLNQEAAENLNKELREKIFSLVADHLGISREIKALDLDSDINLIMKEAGLLISSSDLILRFKSILSTYLKGIRTKLAARDSLSKPVNLGGLNLSELEIDRLFKVCEKKTFKSLEVDLRAINKLPNPVSPTLKINESERLNKIISSAETGTEYNLKQAIALGQIKIPEIKKPEIKKPELKTKLDFSHELSAPKKELDLPLQKKEIDLPLAKKELDLPLTKKGIDLPLPIKKVNLEEKRDEFELLLVKNNLKETVPEKKLVIPVPVKSFELSINKPLKLSPATPFKAVTSVKPIAPVILATPVIPVIPIKSFVPLVVNKPVTPHKAPDSVKVAETNAQISRPTPPPLRPIATSRTSPVTSSSKQVMHDIKPVPKIMGPIEELQFLDLVNFRRLGRTPEEITAKIFSKIKLLEADGYDKMILGVRAWRQSPINHLYLKMMKEAINKGMTIKDFALASQKENKDYLSYLEIEAILSMNSKLIF